jgi:hypothetical protein
MGLGLDRIGVACLCLCSVGSITNVNFGPLWKGEMEREPRHEGLSNVLSINNKNLSRV